MKFTSAWLSAYVLCQKSTGQLDDGSECGPMVRIDRGEQWPWHGR